MSSLTLVARAAIHALARLSDLLIAERHDDAIVVLSVLQIVLRENRVAG